MAPDLDSLATALHAETGDMQRILALSAAIWHNDYMRQPALRSLTGYGH
ncbi:hypothetical protein ACVWXU_004090 [Streptomyces sp. TE33382]